MHWKDPNRAGTRQKRPASSRAPGERGRRLPATALYVALTEILRDRIAYLGWTMQTCDERSGLQDGYTAKLLAPDTPSGRQANFETLQLLIDALYPRGDFRVFLLEKREARKRAAGRARLPL